MKQVRASVAILLRYFDRAIHIAALHG